MPRTALRTTTAALAIAALVGLTGCSSLFGPQRDDAGKVTEAAKLSIGRLQIGDCFNSSVSGQAGATEDTEVEQVVTVVPCNEPHTDEVAVKGNLTGDKLPTGSALEEQVGKICDAAFAKYIGVESIADTDIMYFMYTVQNDSEFKTDKSVTCAIGLEDGGELKRSAKGIKTLDALTAP